jgi:hypothetical protein
MSLEHKNLHEKLLKESVSLNAIYSQAAFELRVGRVGGKKIKYTFLQRKLTMSSQIHQTLHRNSRKHSP